MARATTPTSSTPSSTRSRPAPRRPTRACPSRKGPWWYVSRTVEGLSYAIHCRGSSPETATEQVLLDENERARDQTFFEVGAFDVSHDHRLLAWSADLNGHEVFTLRIRDLDAGRRPARRDRGDLLRHGLVGRRPPPLLHRARPRRCGPTRSGATSSARAQADDVLDPPGGRRALQRRPRAHPQRRVDRHHQRVQRPRPTSSSSGPTIRSARRELVRPAQPDVEYRLDHWGDRFVILTNLDAPDFKVVTAPCDDPRRRAVERPGGPRGRPADHPGRGLRRAPGPPRVVARPASSSTSSAPTATSAMLAFDEPVHSVEHRHEPGVRRPPSLRFGYESLVTPPSVYEEDVVTGERPLLKQMPVLGGFDPTTTSPAREWATAPDGTAGPGGRGVAPRHAARRHGRRVALRLRRLRVLPPAVVLDRPAVAARPGRRLGPRPPARRRRAGPAPGTWTASCWPSATPSPTSSPAPSTSWPRATAPPTGSRSGAAAPAACWSAPASPSDPTCSPGWSPRSPSSTSSPPCATRASR